MKSAATKIICRFLIVCLALLPFQTSAGLVGTEQLVTAASAQADRQTVLNAATRSDVAAQLQALGLDPRSAADRVSAMTDNEVRSLAGQINSLPAGADGAAILLLLIVGALVWWFWFRR